MFALFKDGRQISEDFKDGLAALIHAIDRGIIKIIDGAKYENNILIFDNARNPTIRYEIPKAPYCYEIRETITKIYA